MTMLRLIIIFVLGLLTIPHIYSQSTSIDPTQEILIGSSITASTQETFTAPSTAASTESGLTSSTDNTPFQTSASPIPLSSLTSTSPIPPPPPTSTASPDETTQEPTIVPPVTSSNIPTITVPGITTERPFGPLYQCDFTTSCFGNDQLSITNGTEFSPLSLSSTTEPPRAPTSGATSISKPVTDNTLCQVPYRPQLDDSTDTTTWDMWFCYRNQCPILNGTIATCAPDSYGLISLDPSQTSETVIGSLNPNAVLRDSVGDQCLRFYYYFTVYDGNDWGQQMQVWIRRDNRSDDRVLIGNLTVNEMKDNKWEFQEITFNSAFRTYTLEFNFAVSVENRTADPVMNKTIYFGLDDIDLYDYNCSYVGAQAPTMTRPAAEVTSAPAGAKPNLGLILGLSLGIGIPVLFLAGVSLLYMKKRNGADESSVDGDISMSSRSERTESDPFDNSNAF